MSGPAKEWHLAATDQWDDAINMISGSLGETHVMQVGRGILVRQIIFDRHYNALTVAMTPYPRATLADFGVRLPYVDPLPPEHPPA